jgi:hypothetical protein
MVPEQMVNEWLSEFQTGSRGFGHNRGGGALRCRCSPHWRSSRASEQIGPNLHAVEAPFDSGRTRISEAASANSGRISKLHSEGYMSDPTSRSPRWMPATGGHSDRQLHAMEFIASSLDRIEDHLERIATSLAGSGSHKPFGEAVGDQLRALGEAISRLGRRT